MVVIFRHPERGIEGDLRSVSHLGEGFLERVEKERREGRRRGKCTDSKCSALSEAYTIVFMHLTLSAVTQSVIKGYFHVTGKETGWQHPEWELTPASLGKLGGWVM